MGIFGSADMVPITEARERLKELVERVADRPVVLMRRSRPVAVMVAPERLEALLARVEDLEDELSVLHARLHPEETIPHEKVMADAGLL